MEENSNEKQKENNIQIRIFIVIIIILVLIIVGSWTCVYLLYKDNQTSNASSDIDNSNTVVNEVIEENNITNTDNLNQITLDEIIASKLDVM